MSENLGVEKVAQTDKSANESHRHHKTVESPQRRALGDEIGVEADSDKDAYSPAVACKSAFPDFEYLGRVLRVVVPSVEEHVSEACAHDGADHHNHENRIHPAAVLSLVLEHFRQNPSAEDKADGKHQSVPADGDWR